MGNAKSTSCSNKTSVEEQDLNLTEYDMTIYEHRKEKIFKGTIAICVIYALIALLFIISSYFAPSIKFVIFDKFLPFTIVFIIGTILLIIYLFSNILKFNPIKINKNYDYTNISCPDYWKLEYNSNLQNYFDSNTINTHIFNYRCVLDSNIMSKTDLYFNRKNQLGSGTTESVNNNIAIGMTGNILTNDLLATYTDINKDSLDNDNSKYYIADIKHPKNKEIVNKITGTFDSNVYKNLVESSLLMNNYFFDSNASKNKEYNVYKNISQADTINGFDSTIQTTFSAKNDELDLKPVNFNINSTNTSIANSDVFLIKKNIEDETTTYLDNVDYGTISSGSISKIDLTNFPLVCNRVYPLLLAAKDKELSKKSSGKYDENVLRCAYSKMCGVPWSDMNCDKYEI